MHPSLKLQLPDVAGWDARVAAGPRFVSEGFSDFYYEVTPRHAGHVERWTYDAQAGFGGTQLTAAISRRFDRLWLAGFARYDLLR